MNRAERRRMSKLINSDPIMTIKQSDIEKIKREATEEALVLLLSIPVKVMHERFGWGKRKRLPMLSDALIDEFRAFSEGNVNLKEYQEMVYEFCGVSFKKE